MESVPLIKFQHNTSRKPTHRLLELTDIELSYAQETAIEAFRLNKSVEGRISELKEKKVMILNIRGGKLPLTLTEIVNNIDTCLQQERSYHYRPRMNTWYRL